MKTRTFAILAFLAAFFPAAVSAATFSVLCDNSFELAAKACTVKLSGRVETGDSDRLRSILQTRLLDGWHYGALLLDSPGGNVNAAIEVAALVRQALLNTTTYRLPKDAISQSARGASTQIRWKCVSACFLIWVAGAERMAFSYTVLLGQSSDIGLHRPYLEKSAYDGPPEKVAGRQQQLMQATAEYLKQEQVPQALIEKMLQRASTQVYWLADEDPDITGRAPWFEEMMIARCGYDPTYDRETSVWGSSTTYESAKRQLATGKKKLTPIDLGPRYTKYLEWRQRYNACEYSARAAAQERLR